jgi:3-methyladenine DNA glycosylase AlkD
MILSKKAQKIYDEISERTKLGDLRNIAKGIKTDDELAKELWSTGKLFPRLLSVLIMDDKELNSDVIQDLFDDIQHHEVEERIQLADWLMANQLAKNKKTIALIESWENSSSAMQRRIFWYHQGRLRWVGQTPPNNTKELLSSIEKKMLKENPEVQWAMNFTAAWIGIFDRANRSKCIKIGEKLGLYKDEVVAKGCTPNYLPKFIELEVNKRNLK